MSQMLPPELASVLQGGGDQQQQGGYSPDQSPLDVLRQCINAIPAVIHALPDPRDTQDAVRALLLLTGIQTRMMSGNGTPGNQSG